MSNVGALMFHLLGSCRELSDLLKGVADQQDWSPDPAEWSFRFIAAHMAQVELDAHLDRVVRISQGETPRYDYYSNTDWDFSHLDLLASLSTWQHRRYELCHRVAKLAPEQLMFTGSHAYFGELTVDRVLEIALEHDRGHIRDLKRDLGRLSPFDSVAQQGQQA